MRLTKLNRAEAFRYMGYRGGEIPENIKALADDCETQLLAGVSPKFVWRVFDIQNTADGVAVLNTPLIFRGRDIAAHLSECEKCVLLAATLGVGTDNVIRGFESGEMEKAVIADCLASAAIEQVCDAAEEEIRGAMGGYNFTWRFSPGYGDFPLDIQRDFLNTLNAAKQIGLTVSESLILLPRKSVTAVIGASEREISKGRRGCGSCNMRDVCEFRKNGNRCVGN